MTIRIKLGSIFKLEKFHLYILINIARDSGMNRSERETSITTITGGFHSAFRDAIGAIHAGAGPQNIESTAHPMGLMGLSRSAHTSVLYNPHKKGTSGGGTGRAFSGSVHIRAGPTTSVVFKRAMNKSSQIAVIIVCSFMLLWAPYYVQYFFEVTEQLLQLNKQNSKIRNFSILFNVTDNSASLSTISENISEKDTENTPNAEISDSENQQEDPSFPDWLHLIGLIYALVNPVIYGLFNVKFCKRR